LNDQELKDLIRGCAILGAGGGGSPQRGIEIIQANIEKDREFKLVNLKDIPDKAIVASPYICGSLSPDESSKSTSQDEEIECLKAFESLEDYLG